MNYNSNSKVAYWPSDSHHSPSSKGFDWTWNNWACRLIFLSSDASRWNDNNLLKWTYYLCIWAIP